MVQNSSHYLNQLSGTFLSCNFSNKHAHHLEGCQIVGFTVHNLRKLSMCQVHLYPDKCPIRGWLLLILLLRFVWLVWGIIILIVCRLLGLICKYLLPSYFIYLFYCLFIFLFDWINNENFNFLSFFLILLTLKREKSIYS